jgi:putative ABC transport system permease protein
MIASVALGVAMIFGSLVAIASIERAFDESVQGLQGKADVIATPVGVSTGFVHDDSVAELSRLPHVERVYGLVTVPVTLRGPGGTHAAPELGGGLGPQLVGIDPATAGTLYDFVTTSGSMLDSDSSNAIVLPRRLSHQLGVEVGTSIEVGGPAGPVSLRVLGLLDDTGAGLLNSGDAVFTTIGDARRIVGAPSGVTLVAIDLEAEQDPDAWIAETEALAPPGLSLENADSMSDPVRQIVTTLGAAFSVLTGIVLFIAAFLIAMTLSTAVVQQTQAFGTIRAVGATRRQVRAMVFAQGSILGAVGTAAGLVLGLAVAGGLAAIFRGVLDGLPVRHLVVPPSAAVVAAILGLVVPVVAALVPAARAAAVEPTEALRSDSHAAAGRQRWKGPVVVLAAGLLLSVVATGPAGSAGALLLVLVGGVLATPALVPWVAKTAGSLAGSRGTAGLVADNLARNGPRYGYTIGLVTVVFAMSLAMAATHSSFTKATDRQLAQQFGADLQVVAAASFDRSVVEDVARIPGVRATTLVSNGLVELRSASAGGETAPLRIIDPTTYFGITGFQLVDAEPAAVQHDLEQGGATLLPQALADRLDVTAGDDVTLSTSLGPRPFEVVAVYRSVGSAASNFSPVVVGKEDGGALFNAGDPTGILVDVTPGVEVATVANDVRSTIGSRATFTILTASRFRSLVHDQIRQLLLAFVMVVVVAAGVGIVGLVNTLTVSVLQRSREFGILRAIGAHRSQIRSMAVLEAGLLVATGALLAVPLGFLIAVLTLRSLRSGFGDALDLTMPWTAVAATLVLSIAVASLAALSPARRASRLEIVTALRTT